MVILSIETSCDETAVSVVRAQGTFPDATYTIEGNALHSQIDVHSTYGGVYPAMAKREHIQRIVPLTKKALSQAGLLVEKESDLTQERQETLYELLYREQQLAQDVAALSKQYQKPDIDLIAVTHGPGLEPALWVGVNFAKALSLLWNIPVVPTNHMEGHILAGVLQKTEKAESKSLKIAPVQFPALALLISGGHTELIHAKTWGVYEKVGQTKDDATGEAFDKVARMLDLPYPGGPEIGKRAALARKNNLPIYAELPRPMLHSNDLDFSFSGLKTAVRYAIEDKKLSEDETNALSRDFEDAVTEVLVKKTHDATDTYGIQTIIVGGGVSASQHIRESLLSHFAEHFPEVTLYFPNTGLSTDNAVMIALAGHSRTNQTLSSTEAKTVTAQGNLSLADE